MSSRFDLVIALLHAAGDGVLASSDVAMGGHPFASHLPYVVDDRQRPVFLMSQLAGHTRNIAADPRASLLVKGAGEGAEVPRATLVGEVRPIAAEPLLAARYLRYHPAAEQFLQLGDFRFHRLSPKHIRLVGGFGAAAWLEGTRLLDAPSLSLGEEAQLLAALEPGLPAGCLLLGLDAYGCDCRLHGERKRLVFGSGPLPAASVAAAVGRALEDLTEQ
jgi:hypothetical protein